MEELLKLDLLESEISVVNGPLCILADITDVKVIKSDNCMVGLKIGFNNGLLDIDKSHKIEKSYLSNFLSEVYEYIYKIYDGKNYVCSIKKRKTNN